MHPVKSDLTLSIEVLTLCHVHEETGQVRSKQWTYTVNAFNFCTGYANKGNSSISLFKSNISIKHKKIRVTN